MLRSLGAGSSATTMEPATGATGGSRPCQSLRRTWPALLRDAFIVACNMRNKPEARSYWQQLSAAARAQSLGVCVSNGITEKTLNLP
jgi:hypothetical protein